ncbi:hypothetical protein ACFQ5J_00080 [Lacticaseibacillus baoqingensis]|uniref:Uncharacterized protein n=1 Tax=Lacticaseibacillus baoqingensis TaxID=2486013 RepID=A0ABW4E3B0_9LACO|nr:hypothetical protein [Lacticaseibacillus baoqingensis]
MHEIPETLAQAEALAVKLQWPVDQVITQGLQNWAQQLLDEGFEGGYLTAKLQADGLHIADINGQPLLVEPGITSAWTVRFKEAPHATMLAIQTKLRALIDAGKLH